jgi:hypothetical protein
VGEGDVNSGNESSTGAVGEGDVNSGNESSTGAVVEGGVNSGNESSTGAVGEGGVSGNESTTGDVGEGDVSGNESSTGAVGEGDVNSGNESSTGAVREAADIPEVAAGGGGYGSPLLGRVASVASVEAADVPQGSPYPDLLDSSQQRVTHLVTWSRANVDLLPPGNESDSWKFARSLEVLFNEKCPGIVSHWVAAKEKHTNEGIHFHVALKFKKKVRWVTVANELRAREIYVNFQAVPTYEKAFSYVTKADTQYVKSASHPSMIVVPPKIRNRKSLKRPFQLSDFNWNSASALPVSSPNVQRIAVSHRNAATASTASSSRDFLTVNDFDNDSAFITSTPNDADNAAAAAAAALGQSSLAGLTQVPSMNDSAASGWRPAPSPSPSSVLDESPDSSIDQIYFSQGSVAGLTHVPSLNDSMTPVTSAWRPAPSPSASSSNTSRRGPKLTPYQVKQIIIDNNIKDNLQLSALANNCASNEQHLLAEWVCNNKKKSARLDLINTAWELDGAQAALHEKNLTRMEKLERQLHADHAVHETGHECGGRWLTAALQILERNGIDLRMYQDKLSKCLKFGRNKMNNIFLVGQRNCGKSFLLRPLTLIFSTFCNPASGSFNWVGAPEKEVIFLNDFRYPPIDKGAENMIRWQDLLNLLDVDKWNVPAPKNFFPENIEWTARQPILGNGPREIKYITNGLEDRMETRMMEARVQYIHLTMPMPDDQIDTSITACPRCFVHLVLNGPDMQLPRVPIHRIPELSDSIIDADERGQHASTV